MANSIIIHGGIKEFENLEGKESEYQKALHKIARDSYEVLNEKGARAGVLAAVSALEDLELFNAGTGSRIQADGEIRMSASIMDGKKNIFSGVINIQYVKNPILVAEQLASEKNSVLAGEPATRYARARGFENHNPFTRHRLREHQAAKSGRGGTVGAVALDNDGAIFAATSTGGTGNEIPGRVSDSATVAGNYASLNMGISCTGVGEDIVNLCVAARISTRKLEGLSLEHAIKKTVSEGIEFGYMFGLIALDENGNTFVDQTQGKTLYAAVDAQGIRTFT
ncbi:MAG: isoaspartyl peptidase/L-asparaginase [Arenicellales bacterium]|nr:isoaspartyl peptidase/L-asparaginase [Arenicellales bacterium]